MWRYIHVAKIPFRNQSPSSIPKRAILEFSKINHKNSGEVGEEKFLEESGLEFPETPWPQLFLPVAREITGARFSFIVLWALRKRSKPDTQKDMRYVSLNLRLEFFASFHQQKSYHEMFLQASNHSHKNIFARWLQQFICFKKVKNDLQNWPAGTKT